MDDDTVLKMMAQVMMSKRRAQDYWSRLTEEGRDKIREAYKEWKKNNDR